jgi:NADH:ubiquinone reductase (H+-translocating)
MSQRVVVIGAGFAGMWAALSAARALELAGRNDGSIEIIVVAPEPSLHVRPRLYEPDPASMTAPLLDLFAAIGIRFRQGMAEEIKVGAAEIMIRDAGGAVSALSYDRLVLASGSRLFRPAIPGLDRFAFSVDQTDEAATLDRHLRALATRPASAARDAVVVAGGGFTGIELAAELPARLRGYLGPDAAVRVILVEQADAIGPDLGPGPRPVIETALDAAGVERRLGAAVTAVGQDFITLGNGERIATDTVVWTAGARAQGLTAQVPGQRDRFGRLQVDADLRVPDAPHVFAAGDVAHAATDDLGNVAAMSCQHAMALGRSAGHNAAQDLMGLPLRPYSQVRYVTCLDLGPWGAVLTEGWERAVVMQGADAKDLKRQINSIWIYPPAADRAAIMEAADPARPVVA